MTYFGLVLPPAVYVAFYVVVFVGAVVFLVTVSRKHAPSKLREPFRKPALIRAAGLLLFAAAGILVFTMDGTGDRASAPSWSALTLQGCLALAGMLLIIVGGRLYLRAGDAYPPGKHAAPDSAPDRRHDTT